MGSKENVDDDRLSLEPEDISFYDAPMWLNDYCIEFWLEHVYYDLLKKNPDIVFVCPSTMSIVCHMTPDMVAESVKLLKLPERHLVFMPINDNNVGSSAGGSHWSLLVYSRSENAFRYYDSMRGSANIETAKACSKNLQLALETPKGPSFINEASTMPQQTNGYDCGLYLLLTAQLLASCFAESGSLPSVEQLQHAVSPLAASELRVSAKKLAQSMRAPTK